MKFKLLIVLVLCLGMATVNVMAQSIANSAHDFSGESYTSEICNVCHTPHNASATVKPLWNHQMSGETYTLYTSSTLDASVDDPGATTSSSLCLSCHDGTVAIDNFGGTTTGADYVTSGLLGTDLSNDHPVNFTYNTALSVTDPGLHDPSTQTSGLGGTIDADLLKSNKVQCASCHNPHDDTIDNFLVKSNATSALCLTCHDK